MDVSKTNEVHGFGDNVLKFSQNGEIICYLGKENKLFFPGGISSPEKIIALADFLKKESYIKHEKDFKKK